MEKEKNKNEQYKDQLLDALIGCIKRNKVWHDKYYGGKQKYDISTIIRGILEVLRLGISWRKVKILAIANGIHWNTFYKTYVKLLDDGIIEESFRLTVKRYMKCKPASKMKIQMTDTTIINNKLGQEKVGRNKMAKGKKITKISIITDSKGIPIHADIYAGNINDSKIFRNQITEKNITDNPRYSKYKKIMLADKGYDSQKLRHILQKKGYIPIIPFNKRNTKDENKIKHLSDEEKKIYKRRILIEHTFMKLKKYRRLDVRYDRTYKTFKGFALIGLIDIILKST